MTALLVGGATCVGRRNGGQRERGSILHFHEVQVQRGVLDHRGAGEAVAGFDNLAQRLAGGDGVVRRQHDLNLAIDGSGAAAADDRECRNRLYWHLWR